jgi:hypothetical protein
MNFIRRAVATSGQTAVGVSVSRRWAVTTGVITVEAAFEVDAGVTCTALTIDIEGSLTRNNFFPLASHAFTSAERTARCCMFHVIDKPITWVRTNITKLTSTGVGDVRVTVDLLSYD